MPAPHNFKTITDNEMKFGGVVKNHKLIHLVLFNWHMTSSLRQNFELLQKSCSVIKVEKFRDVSDLKHRQINGTKLKENFFLNIINSILKKLSITKSDFSALKL